MMRYSRLLIGGVAVVVGAVAFVLSGLPEIASSVSLSRVTTWVQGVAVRQSVTLRSLGISVPPLDDDPAMIRRGAGHYDLVCATCHGSPAGAPDAIADDMVPAPPRLMDQMDHWRPPARIFWTVKHGIRFSAMPAFPTQMRDDEVWALVAFLRTMPETSRETYAELVDLDAATTCAQCHGDGDASSDPAFPRLDLQSPEYIAASLRAFRSGQRASGTMMAAAARLSDAEIDTLASTFGRRVQVGVSCPEPIRNIITRGVPAEGIPACESCHGTNARAGFPRLAGQRAGYMLTQLHLFSEYGADRGGRYAEIMATAVRNVPPEMFPDLAACYAGDQ